MAAAPQSKLMNSRRLIASPESRRGIVTVQTRLVKGCPMSALGHKRTYAVQNGMSALLPKATAKADSRKRSCLLYPKKRTCAAQQVMSALVQKRTKAPQQ